MWWFKPKIERIGKVGEEFIGKFEINSFGSYKSLWWDAECIWEKSER